MAISEIYTHGKDRVKLMLVGARYEFRYESP